MSDPFSTGYSAKVRLWLECEGEIIPLAQVAPDWIMPDRSCDLPASKGVVVVEVDGIEHRRPVLLPEGISADSTRVNVQPQATAA